MQVARQVVYLVVAALTGACTSTVAGQPAAAGCSNRPDERMEAFFARLGTSQSSHRPERFRFVLSFLPSFHPETRIVVSQEVGSSPTITYQAFEKSLRKAMDADEASATHGTAVDLAREAGLHEKQLPVATDQAWSWLQVLANSLANSATMVQRRAVVSADSKEVSIQLDGTLYVLVIDIGEVHLSIALPGPEVGAEASAEDSPLVRSMDSVRDRIEELAKLRH